MNRREAFTAMMTLPLAAVLPKPDNRATVVVTLDEKAIADSLDDEFRRRLQTQTYDLRTIRRLE